MRETDLTVLMTVRNGEIFLRKSIESILNQSYQNFKFLILDNASTDNSKEIIKSYSDSRVDLVELKEDIGQVAALQMGLDICQTKYIARMDADDISMPDRFAKQILFLERNPEVGVCGTFAIVFSDTKELFFSWPTEADDIKVKLHFECCLAHPTVIIRREFFIKFNLNYNARLKHSYDWDLWQRCSRYFPLANIPEFLLRYRLSRQSESFRTRHLQKSVADLLDHETLRLLKLNNHPLKRVNRDVAMETLNLKNRPREFLESVLNWFDQLRTANKKYGLYADASLEKFLKKRLFLVLNYGIRYKKEVLKIFIKEKIFKYIEFKDSLKFIIKVVLACLGIYQPYVK